MASNLPAKVQCDVMISFNTKDLAFTEKIAGILNAEECIHYVQGMCNLFIHLPPFSICSLH